LPDCTNISLAAGDIKSCGSRGIALTQSVTNTITAVGTASALNDVSDTTSVSVKVVAPVYSLELLADPLNLSTAGQSMTTTISVLVKDQFNDPPLAAVTVQLTTTQGYWPNNGQTDAVSLSSGQASHILTLADTDTLAEVTAEVVELGINNTIAVTVHHPDIALIFTASQPIETVGQRVTFNYTIKNIGKDNLTQITLVDDNGTPENSEDDVPINCPSSTLNWGLTMVCKSRDVIISSPAAVYTAVAGGRDSLFNLVQDSQAINGQKQLFLPLIFK